MKKEQDLEAVILQKLRVMEDLLKSFMSSLEEPPLKKGILYEVRAPGTGTILKWYRGEGLVKEGEPLCYFEYRWIPLIKDILADYSGYLRIKPWAKEGTLVEGGKVIATIETIGVPI